MQFLPLYIHLVDLLCFLNDNIEDIEKRDGICSLTFVEDDLSGLFLHPSVFPIKDLRTI